VIGVGEPLPAARVWSSPQDKEGVRLETLACEGPLLLLFYLYDWSTT
jgi:hypothetical protein